MNISNSLLEIGISKEKIDAIPHEEKLKMSLFYIVINPQFVLPDKRQLEKNRKSAEIVAKVYKLK